MLTPYIMERDCIRFVGRCVKDSDSDALQDKISSLFAQMDEIFASIENPMDEKFYGVSANFVNSSPNSTKTYWLCKEVESLKTDGQWRNLHAGMETLVIPAARWLYIPVRYDDEFVLGLAPKEYQNDNSYLTVCVLRWARNWLKQHDYEEHDFPYELEIYGLYDGYEGLGANITLALPIK